MMKRWISILLALVLVLSTAVIPVSAAEDNEAKIYSLSMTFNENYPMRWFTVGVAGSGAEKVSLQKTDSGYLISSDCLQDVTVQANNREDTVEATFSTTETMALICETPEGALDVRIDTDHDGVYETSLLNPPEAEPEESAEPQTEAEPRS